MLPNHLLLCTGLLVTVFTSWAPSFVRGLAMEKALYGGRSKRSSAEGSEFGAEQTHQLYFHEIKPAAHMETFLHESISLTCQAGGSPPPTIHWLKDGKAISQDSYDNTLLAADDEVAAPTPDGSITIGLSSTRSRLFLDCLTPEDTAIYTCVAQTAFSRISTDTKLIVSEIANKLGSSECASSAVDKRNGAGYGSPGKPARITMWTDTRMELTGADVKLFCRVSGTPTPQVTWERSEDGQVIHNDAKHKILANGDLIIKKVSWEEDMGRFVCVAQNNLGVDKAKMFLYPTSGL